MIAVVKTGGKQYKVREGETLIIEKVDQAPGEALTLEVLLTGEEDGKNTKLGAPTVAGAKVEGRVLEHGKGEKVSIFKFKPKVRYRRHTGHRQLYSRVKIERIIS